MTSTLIEEQNGLCLIKGDIDFYSVVRIRQQGDRLIKLRGPEIMFDFRAVRKVDSSGLALMLAWLKKANQLKKTLRFTSVPRSLQSMATLYDVSHILRMA